MSGDNYNSCSHLYLIFNQLIKHLEERLKDMKFYNLKLTIESMLMKLKEYWEKIKPMALICSILDPRFKKDFLEKNDKKIGVKLLEDLLKEYKQKYPDSEKESSSNLKGLLFLKFFTRLLFYFIF